MNITRVLSVSAIILGLYILFSFLFGRSPHIEDLDPFSKTKQNFHVGCYANDQKLTHYYDIASKIEDLKHESWIKQKESSIMSSDVLEKRGVEVARNFQNFISEYSNYKSRSQISHQLTRAVITAKQHFKQCVDDIFFNTQSFQSECTGDWKLYEKCFSDIDLLKGKLKEELDNKMTVMQKINDFLYQSGQDKLKNSPHDQYMKQFKRKDKALEEQEKRLQSEIKLLYERISQAQYNYTVAKNKTNNAFYLYSECSQHRTQFRLCEQLTKETLSLGKNDNIESLGQKVQRKRTAIAKMQQYLNQNSRGELTSQFRDSYQEYFEDYKRLLKLYVQTKAKIRKHCGCSQEQEQKLRQSYLQKKKEEQEKLIQHKRFVAMYQRRKPELEEMKERRRVLLEQLEAKMKKIKSAEHQPVKPNHDSILAQLKKQKEKHEFQIISLNSQFTELQKQCEKISNKISKRIPEISKIKECLNKYQYYSEIKTKVERENPKEIKMNEVLKRRLVESVQNFAL